MTEEKTFYIATFIYDDASIESLVEYKLGLWSSEELAMKKITEFKHSKKGDEVRSRIRIPNPLYDKGWKQHTYAKYVISRCVVDCPDSNQIVYREDDERYEKWINN